MDLLLEYARGPLFRLTFAIMVLGLLRVFILDIYGMVEAYLKAGDKNIPWKLTLLRTFEWLFPVKRVLNHRPIYSLIAIVFHIGLLLVPIFLFAHIQLWESGLGVTWPALSRSWADILTVTTIVSGLAIFIGRAGSKRAREISRKQDYSWPLVLVLPFITGFICTHATVNPTFYQIFMLIHILSAETIFVLLPFSKLAHCILMPLSQFVYTLAWKFPARVDDDVCTTLNKKGAKV